MDQTIMDQRQPIKKQFAFTASRLVKTPQFCAAIVVFFVLLVNTQGSPQCSMKTEFTIFYPDNPNAKESCQKCLKCDVGYGLPVQCGVRVPHGTPTDCIPCPANAYSDTNGAFSCRPCEICKGRRVLKRCTQRQNRVCEASTCMKNYYLDYKEDPPKCTLNTTLSTRPPVNMTVADNHSTLSVTEKSWPPSASAVDKSRGNSSESSDNVNKGNVIIYGILGAIVAPAVICLSVIVTYMCRGRSQSERIGDESELKTMAVQNHPESPANPSEEDQVLAQEVAEAKTRIPKGCLVSEMEKLCDGRGNLMFFYVQEMLDVLPKPNRKTWRGVGQALGLSSKDLDLIEIDYAARRSPTESLIGKLKTLPKELTMIEFVEALVKCKRNDVANYISNWPWEKSFASVDSENQPSRDNVIDISSI